MLNIEWEIGNLTIFNWKDVALYYNEQHHAPKLLPQNIASAQLKWKRKEQRITKTMIFFITDFTRLYLDQRLLPLNATVNTQFSFSFVYRHWCFECRGGVGGDN